MCQRSANRKITANKSFGARWKRAAAKHCYSITSSARPSSDSGKLRRSRLAVLRLSTKSHSPSSPSPLRVSMAGVGHDRPQDWIVGVALLRAAIERLAIGGAKRHIEIKPGYKIRVADEGLAERDEIGARLRDGLVGALAA